MKVIAINALERAKDADPVKVKPGDILELTGKELKIALAANAVREPTEDEVLLHDARKAQAEKLAAEDDADDEVTSTKGKGDAGKGKSTTKKTDTGKKAAEKGTDAESGKTPEKDSTGAGSTNDANGGSNDDIVID